MRKALKIENYTAYSHLYSAYFNGQLDDLRAGICSALERYSFNELKQFTPKHLSMTPVDGQFAEALANLADDYHYLSDTNWLDKLNGQDFYDDDFNEDAENYEDTCVEIIDELGARLLFSSLADTLSHQQLSEITIRDSQIGLTFVTDQITMQFYINIAADCCSAIEVGIGKETVEYQDNLYSGDIDELIEDSEISHCLQLLANTSSNAQIHVQVEQFEKYHPLTLSPNSLARDIYCFRDSEAVRKLVGEIHLHGDSALLDNPSAPLMSNLSFLNDLCHQGNFGTEIDPIEIMHHISNSIGEQAAQKFIDTYFQTNVDQLGRSIPLSLVSLCSESVQTKLYQSCSTEIATSLSGLQSICKTSIPQQSLLQLDQPQVQMP